MIAFKSARGRQAKYRVEPGDRFGNLTVVEQQRGRVLCECTCGARITVSVSWLTVSGKSSCGCEPRQRRRYGPLLGSSTKSIAKRLLRDLQRSAHERGLDCTIAESEMRALCSESTCTYCDDPIPPTYAGLDRIDNTKGYTSANVLRACANCNIARGHLLSVDQFMASIACRRASRPMDSLCWEVNEWRDHDADRMDKALKPLTGYGGRKRAKP